MNWYDHVRNCFFGDGPSTAKWVAEHHPEDAKATIKDADMVASDSFVFNRRWDMERTSTPVTFSHGIDWLFQNGDDNEFVYAFNRMEFWKTLGEAWLLTGEEKYPEAFARQLHSWVETVPHDKDHAKAWRTIECGIRMEVWMKALKMMEGSKAVDDNLLDLAFRSLKEHARFIAEVWDSYQLLSNWGIMANHGLFVTSVMLAEDEQTTRWRKTALERLSQELAIQVYDDGVQWEQSAMYHNDVLSQMLDVLSLAKDFSIPLPEGMEEKIHQMARFARAMVKPDGNEPSFGDSDVIDMRDILERACVLFQDPDLKMGNETVSSDAAWEIGIKGISLHRSLAIGKPVKHVSLFADGGHAYWNDGTLYVHAKAGTLGAGHGHADQLAFDLFYGGEDVLVDPGRYTYVPGPERYWFKSSEAHNTVLVDATDTYEAKDSWEYRRMSKTSGIAAKEKHGYAMIKMGLLGYMDKGVFVCRKIIILSSDLVLILDELYGTGSHTLESYLHFAPCGKLSLSGTSALWESDRQKLFVQSPGIDSVQRKEGWYSPHYNQRIPSERLSFVKNTQEFSSSLLVLSFGHKPKVTKLPVTSNFKHITFPESLIEAWKVDDYTVVASHKEWGSPTDSFHVDGHTGWGQCVVFGPKDRDIGWVLEY